MSAPIPYTAYATTRSLEIVNLHGYKQVSVATYVRTMSMLSYTC